MHRPIHNSAQAQKEYEALKSYWSEESRLSQRILIYIAELLENRGKRAKRKPTAWQKFLATELRNGKTIQQAAAAWKERPGQKK